MINIVSLIKKDFLTLIIVVLLSFLIFFSNDSKYVEKVESKILDLFSVFLYPQNWYENLLLIKEENKLLKQKNTQLNMLNAKLINFSIENNKLREMLTFKEAYSKLNLMPANIVNHNFSSSPNVVIIDLGGDDGIEKNLPVIDMNGLVGKTITTGKNASKVQIVTDKNFAVSVKVGSSMQHAIFKPDYGKLGFLEGVVKSVKLKQGDIIYTSGISEIYPSDIPVCQVLEVVNDSDKPYLNVIVEILADLSNLNYVFIIQ